MKEIISFIPHDIIKFGLVLIFSLGIGIEQRRLHIKLDAENTFGTDRTFTLIGLLGYVLYIIAPQNLTIWILGGGAITVFLSIYYFMKIKMKQLYGITSMVIALLTYCLAPLICTQPLWLVLLLVVCILILTEVKESLMAFTRRLDNDEFITLAKFLVLAGVVLPLLPDTPISKDIAITPYKFWLSVVVVSAISYLSYLLRKFVFPNAGMLLTGILGGLYSSTATTVILARKSKEAGGGGYAAAMMVATGMMYLRLFLLALFFNKEVAFALAPYFGVFFVIALAAAFVLLKLKSGNHTDDKNADVQDHPNPLEFKTALFFAGLFIFFAIVTSYVFKYYGSAGISGMSYIVGVTDIDPFILNLFQHNGAIPVAVVVTAVVNATASNNLLKLIYGISLGDRSLRNPLIFSYGLLIVAGFAAGLLAPVMMK